MASNRRHGHRHHYDSVSSDTEYSEPEEHRKGCIKRSKYVHHCIAFLFTFGWLIEHGLIDVCF